MAETTETKEYLLGQFRFEDNEIECGGFKANWKIKADATYPTNSLTATRVKYSEMSYDWECSEINPKFRQYFKEMWAAQVKDPNSKFTIATYDLNLEGDPVEDDVYYNCWIEDVSKEDANGKFTVKGGALSMKL